MHILYSLLYSASMKEFGNRSIMILSRVVVGNSIGAFIKIPNSYRIISYRTKN